MNLRSFVFFLFFLGHQVCAQETLVLPANPASAKWYQLKTPGFKILYTKGFEAQAQRMANTLETIREPEAKGMNTLPRRIPLVLQSMSAQSNAFVTLAPRRSEFYAMPSQDYNFIGNLDWLNLLAVHEYRHIAQFQRSITGFNKFLFYTLGQQATSAMAFASAPQWFWEGDAVATETAFTNGGRGRIPNFDLIFRTNLLEGRAFNYNKQYLRSYKHFIPNHYVLGYQMVSALRRQTGKANSFGNIAGRTWAVPFIPFAFSNSMKKEIGYSLPQFYNKVATDLKSEYEKQLSQIELTPFENVTLRKNGAFTNYLYPQVLADGSIAALKSGIGDIDQVVVFQEGKEVHKKFVTGPLNESGFLSAAKNTVVWNEYRYDPRWPVKDYSVIRGFDFAAKLRQQVSRKTRFAGAALSPDGNKVLTVETDTSYHTKLVVIDYASGKIEKEFVNPDNAFYSMSRWANDGQGIVSLKNTSDGKSVVLIEYQSGREEELLPKSSENVGYPIIAQGYLLYNSPRSGIDNIYALDLNTRKQFQVTSAKYGAYNPCLSTDGKTLYYNNQGKNGMDVVKATFDPSKWKAIEYVKAPAFNTYDHLAQQEGHRHLLDSVGAKEYPTSRYSKLLHAINIHSWGAYVESDLTRASVGVTSKNILSTTQIKAGYEFDIQERTGVWKATASMQAWYPVVDFSYSNGNRTANLGTINYLDAGGAYITLITRHPLTIDWHEQTVEGGIRIPLNLTRSKFYSNLSVSNYVGATSVSKFKNNVDGGGRLLPVDFPKYFLESYLDNGTLLYNSLHVSYYSLMKRSTRDINSKWGHAFFMRYQNTPYGKDFTGSNFSLTGYLYLPGLFKHHSLWGYWAMQSTEMALHKTNIISEFKDHYIFRNQIPLPRGLSDYISRHERMYSMSVNYTMPIWYPDVSTGPFLNFKRLRGNGFVDYAFGDNPQQRSKNPGLTTATSYFSVGGELKFDINIMRFLPELNIGFRYSYGLQPNVTKFEFLLGTFNF